MNIQLDFFRASFAEYFMRRAVTGGSIVSWANGLTEFKAIFFPTVSGFVGRTADEERQAAYFAEVAAKFIYKISGGMTLSEEAIDSGMQTIYRAYLIEFRNGPSNPKAVLCQALAIAS